MQRSSAVPDQLYQLLIDEAAGYAIMLLDRRGVIQKWNRGAEQLFGYGEHEVIGRSGELIFLPEEINSGAPTRELQEAAAKGQATDRRWKRRKDGSRFFGDGMMIALHDPDGGLLGFAKILRDATAEKSWEDERNAAERELRLIIDSVHDYAIYMLDPEGRILTWSRGAERIKGYKPDEVIGRNFEIFYPPEDVAAGKPRRQLEIAAANGTYEDESMHVRKDGSRFWAAVVVSAVRNEDGELTGFVNLTHDVTDRKRNRERLEVMASTSRILATSIDYGETLRGIAKIAVPRIADWCAIDLLTAQQTLSRVTVEHVDPAKVELAKELQKRFPPSPDDPGMRQAIHDRKTVFYPAISDAVLRAITDPERQRVVRELGLSSAIITPLVAADQVLGAITFVTSGHRHLTKEEVTLAEDIAWRAAIAVRNAELYREAQEANRAKDDFLATVSHELRTPMTAVLGWAKLMKSENDPETIREATAAIERSATTQVQLINDILDIARIRVGKLQMRFDVANLAEVVAAAVDTVWPAAESKHIQLRVDAKSQDVPVRGDSVRLQQVVWNLLTNAVKFTPDGGRVDLLLEKQHEIARITVRDTGAGIAPEFLPQIFQRFFQVETTQRRGHAGLGLGLSIARYIVEAHGGTIAVSSDGEGNGAMFTVELPLLTEDGRRAPRGGRRSTDPFESLGGLSALVVEDDRDTLNLFCRVLEIAGAEVRSASSVDDALRLIEARQPDVIVSDIAMPLKDGYDLVRAVRAKNPDLPMIAVTASGAGGDRDRALSAGFDEYLRKPIDPHTLVQMVWAIGKRQSA